jgi:uncharacterized protein with PQ loop repeat
MDEDQCPQRGVGGIVLGSVLTAGIFLSYLPQHVIILKRRSSAGLSLYMLLLSNIASFTVVLGAVLLEWSEFQCCHSVGFGECQAILLSLYQLLVGFVNLLPMYALALYYMPERFERKQSDSARRVYYRHAIIYGVYVLGVVALSAASFVLIAVDGKQASSVRTLGKVLGVVAAAATVVQWAPQIYEVYKNKGPGSLSLLMLLLQAPGALACAILQGVFYQEDWTTWVSYLCMFVQEAIIICQLAFYHFRKRRRRAARGHRATELEGVLDQDRHLLSSLHLDDDDSEGGDIVVGGTGMVRSSFDYGRATSASSSDEDLVDHSRSLLALDNSDGFFDEYDDSPAALVDIDVDDQEQLYDEFFQ